MFSVSAALVTNAAHSVMFDADCLHFILCYSRPGSALGEMVLLRIAAMCHLHALMLSCLKLFVVTVSDLALGDMRIKVYIEWWGAGMVICLERGADLHMAQLMLLPLTVSSFSKIQIGITFLVLAHLGRPGKRAVKHMCVCVCFIMYLV